MSKSRLALATSFVLASLTHANAQVLVRDLDGFKAIPTPQGVECEPRSHRDGRRPVHRHHLHAPVDGKVATTV
jgi:hypothetical protein